MLQSYFLMAILECFLPWLRILLVTLQTMERIKLSTYEKQVLRKLRDGHSELLNEFDIPSVCTLEDKGLVRAAHIEGGGIEAVMLTQKGKAYLHYYPKLNNPIDWAKVGAIAAILTVLISFVALFIACQSLSFNH